MSDDFSASAQNGYDPTKVYRGTTNIKGFSARMRIALPPEALALASEIAATRCIDGLKTPADMMRDAFIHRLHAYEEMLKSSNPVLAAQCANVRRRMAAEADLDRLLEQRQADNALADKAMKLYEVGGLETLPMVREALNTISTQEAHDRLAFVLSRNGS